jgi:hypothetical protein
MLFDIPFVADWNKISAARKNKKLVNDDYKVGDRVLVIHDGILHKAHSPRGKEPWTITTVHTNRTIRIQRGAKSERINIRRVAPYTGD